MPVNPDEQVQAVATLFDSVADTYENVGVNYFSNIAADLLTHVTPIPGERWLDVGCGRGAVLLPAAAGIGAQGQIVGIDISANMLEHTRQAAADRGLTNIELFVADAQEPGFDEPTFDTVTCCLVLFFTPNPAAVVATWRRLLTPGGRVGVTTFGEADPRWAEVDELLGPHMPRWRRESSEEDSPFASDESMERLVSGAGFTDVRTELGSVDVRFANIDRWFDFSWSHGQRAMWTAMSENDRTTLRADLIGPLSAIAESDGSLQYRQHIRHTLASQPTT